MLKNSKQYVPTVRTDDQKQNVLINVRSTVAGYIMYWHKLCLEITVFLSTVIIAIGTFVLTRPESSNLARNGVIAFVVLLCLFGCYVIYRASRLLNELRLILVKVDTADGLFLESEYIDGKTIYPLTWEKYDAVSMADIPNSCIFIIAILGIIVSVLLLK